MAGRASSPRTVSRFTVGFLHLDLIIVASTKKTRLERHGRTKTRIFLQVIMSIGNFDDWQVLADRISPLRPAVGVAPPRTRSSPWVGMAGRASSARMVSRLRRSF